ncbi:MAG: hypothetical protein K2L72_04565 [Clostridia bacterium]|nr:hypothetical protein [Clostridia bacterium]
MFFRKQQKELDKEITESVLGAHGGESGAIINVKIDGKEQLYSPYSYSGDKLSGEFCEYVYERAKRAPITEDLTINIHSAEELDAAEIESTLKKHYGRVYLESKGELRRVTTISLIMTVFGVIALAVMVLLNHLLNNFYVSTIIEIAAWVFVWEAVDYFFLQRPLVKAKLILIQRIYKATVEINRTQTDGNGDL